MIKKEINLKRKPKYGMFSCVKYIYNLMWKYERSIVLTAGATIPVDLILSIIGLYMAPMIVQALAAAQSFSYIALIILGFLTTQTIFSIANMFLTTMRELSEHQMVFRMTYIAESRKFDMDYFLDLDPKIKEIITRARKAICNNHTACMHFPMDFANMITIILKFFLFGSIISMLNPIIILLLTGGCAVNYIMEIWERKQNYETADTRNRLERKIDYLVNYISENFQFGKDIRLYCMRDFLNELSNTLIKQIIHEKSKIVKRNFSKALVSFLILFIRDGAAYIILISKAVTGDINAAEFSLYFTAITSMSGIISDIIGVVSRTSEGAMQISDFREFISLPDVFNRGEGIPVPKKPFSIEFKNVSFKYPAGENKILDNISFKIEAGERIALVGLNGAGKTTLTKLMCGLLIPDEGEILLDGHTLYEYNRDEMYTLFGLVPQNYHLFPISIAQNIAITSQDEPIDTDRLKQCLELAGLTEKINSLPLGVETPLNRQINEDAVELSGGEVQKLLLARLLYQKPKCIVLDEPTSALDPIAEDKMYRKYDEVVEKTTSIFISHRLASTRFCGRIFLLDGEKIVETGTHDELMKAGGKYRELFDIQSKYYKDGGDNHDRA